MFVIIVGGGKTGSFLTEQLVNQGHKVCLVEIRPQIAERLKKDIPENMILVGDGSSPNVLEQAGVLQADVLAAVTGEDETNLVITTLGKFEFHVPRTIARVNNPKNAWLFNDKMGVDIAVNQTTFLSKLIVEEISLGDMMVLLKLRSGDYSIVEERVHPDAPAVQKTVKELDLPQECNLVAILRGEKLIIPKGDTVFQPMDEVIALIYTPKTNELASYFGIGE